MVAQRRLGLIGTQVNNIRHRIAVYLLVGAGLTLVYAFLRGTSWHGSATLHTVMEAMATLLALVVGAMALVRYYSRKNNSFLFIGAGFLGTALFWKSLRTEPASPWWLARILK